MLFQNETTLVCLNCLVWYLHSLTHLEISLNVCFQMLELLLVLLKLEKRLGEQGALKSLD